MKRNRIDVAGAGLMTFPAPRSNTTNSRELYQTGRRAVKQQRSLSVSQRRNEGIARAGRWLASTASLDDTYVFRVLLVGDLHGNEMAAAQTFGQAVTHQVDVIAQVGDFGIWPGASGQDFLDFVETCANETDIPLVFVDGNHEDFPQLLQAPVAENGWRAIRPGVVHAPRGHVWNWSTVRFGALGGAVSVDKQRRTAGVSWWAEEQITYGDLLRLEQNAPDGVDVLLTHDTPFETDLSKLPQGGFPADALREADMHRQMISAAVMKTRPNLLVHGHYHLPWLQEVNVDGHSLTVTGLDIEGVDASYALLTL